MGRPVAVGAYIFAGGFTQGIKKSFDVLCHLEASSYGVATSMLNHRGLLVYQNPERWPTETLRGRVDLVYANPPCAPWSAAGSKVAAKGPKRDYSRGFDPRDERVGCLRNVFGLLTSIQPRVLVTESVTRLWTAGRPLVEAMAREARAAGYAVEAVLHDAYDCGAPQHRKRVLLVFSKIRIPWARPVAPEGAPRTVRDAIACAIDPRPEIAPMWGEEKICLAATAPGGKLRETYGRIAAEAGFQPPRGRPGFLCRRLRWDAPSPTHTGSATLYHPAIDRKISVVEAQILCGYPAAYEFVATVQNKYKQIAQAVTPPVGRWVGETVAAGLAAGEPAIVEATIACHDFLKP